MKKPTITVLYSCSRCGAKDESVEVPARLSPDEDIKFYVEKVIGGFVGAAHGRRHLMCDAKKMDNVKIPLGKEDDPDNWIGKHHPK